MNDSHDMDRDYNPFKTKSAAQTILSVGSLSPLEQVIFFLHTFNITVTCDNIILFQFKLFLVNRFFKLQKKKT